MPGKSYCQVRPGYLSRSEPVNSNLTKCQVITKVVTLQSCSAQQVIIRFESGKMYRLTEPGKNARFYPNLDSNSTILQIQINSPRVNYISWWFSVTRFDYNKASKSHDLLKIQGLSLLEILFVKTKSFTRFAVQYNAVISTIGRY